MSQDVDTIYRSALRNTHAAELQGLQQMERQLEGLEHYPAYAELLQRHIVVTREQLSRLDRALQDVGTSESGLKEMITGAAGNLGATIHALAPDETLKNLYAGYAYQYEQIAAYRSLAVIAVSAGRPDHVAMCEQAIREEEQAAEDAAALIEPVTRTYITLQLSGKKADS